MYINKKAFYFPNNKKFIYKLSRNRMPVDMDKNLNQYNIIIIYFEYASRVSQDSPFERSFSNLKATSP
jgi:hypothetical protein